MAASGGLKLSLESSDDRRVRFAHVTLWRGPGADATVLVTDARGRMRYRLDDGDYRLAVAGAPPREFSVQNHRWTNVRVAVA